MQLKCALAAFCVVATLMLHISNVPQAMGAATTVRPYKFGFNVAEQQHRSEQRDEKGIVMGEFGFITADGIYHVTVYATDEEGKFRILAMRSYPYETPPKTINMIVTPKELKVLAPTTTSRPAPPPTPAPTQAPSTLPKYKFSQEGCSGCFLKKTPIEPVPEVKSNIRPLSQALPSGVTGSSGASSGGSGRAAAAAVGGSGGGGSAATAPAAGGKASATPGASSSSSGGGGAGRAAAAGAARPSSTGAATSGATGKKSSGSGGGAAAAGGSGGGRSGSPAAGAAKINPSPAGSGKPAAKSGSSGGGGFAKSGAAGKAGGSGGGGSASRAQSGGAAQKSNGPLSFDLRNNAPSGGKLGGSGAHGGSGAGGGSGGSGRSGGAGGAGGAHGGDGDLYHFKYVLDYNGHEETGSHNGNKVGNYFAIGEDNVERTIEYVANEHGYQPRINWKQIGAAPKSKENTLKSYEFVWFNKP